MMSTSIADDALRPLVRPDHDGTTPGASVGAVDDATLRAMIAKFHSAVWRTLRNCGVLAADLDDAMQQVFIVASQKLHLIEEGRERAFLIGIAVRIASRTRRSRDRRRRIAMASQSGSGLTSPTPADELDRAEERRLFEAILETLPEGIRSVFVMYEVEGLTLAEIGEILGLPMGTVGSRLRRARDLFVSQVRRNEAKIQFEGGR